MLDEIGITYRRMGSGPLTRIGQRCQRPRVRERIIGIDEDDAGPRTREQTFVHREVDACIWFGYDAAYAIPVATNYVDRAICR